MKILLSFLVLLFICSSAFPAKPKTLSPESKTILEKYNELKLDLGNNKIWREYLNLIPGNNTGFKKTFAPDDFSELYDDSDDYISILHKAPRELTGDVLRLIIDITKSGAPACCDAWSSLHSTASEIILKDIGQFVTLMKTINKNQKSNVIYFLADKEAIRYAKFYQDIIDKMNSINEKKLVSEFESAREIRILKRHD